MTNPIWNTWKMAYLENSDTAHILEWNQTETAPLKKIPLSMLREEDVQLMLVSPASEFELFHDFLKEEQRYYPVALAAKVTLEDFQNLSVLAREEQLKNEYDKWLLNNNLQTLEEFFPYLEHMRKLRVEQYSLFFEELWFFFKRNTGLNHQRLIFHDIKDSQDGRDPKEGERTKSKLELITLEGKRHPHGKMGNELEQKLFRPFPYHSEGPFYSLQFIEEKGQLIFSGTLRGSSFFLMGSTLFLNRLQRAILHTFMEGLNRIQAPPPSPTKATSPRP